MEIINPTTPKVAYLLGEECQKLFLKFLQKFKENNKFKYRELLQKIRSDDRTVLPISFRDVMNFDEKLAENLMVSFYRILPYLNSAVKSFAQDVCPDDKIDLICSFRDVPLITKLRNLRTINVGKLLKIKGHVVRSNAVHPEMVVGTFKCADCGWKIRDVIQKYVLTQPTICGNNKCNNRTSFEPDLTHCKMQDMQKVMIQETQAELPLGLLPRTMEVILRRDQVEHAHPGDLCEFTGCLIQVPDISQIAAPGMKVAQSKPQHNTQGYEQSGVTGVKGLGQRIMTYKLMFDALHVRNVNNDHFMNTCAVESSNYDEENEYGYETLTIEKLKKRMTEDELGQIYQMSRDPQLVTNISNSLFPNIYGNDEVKKGIMLMLFGGVTKQTTEETRLRGDINLCIVGDPSTGKSQFLSRINQFSDRSVYTSGKASSAAGLTAAVVRDVFTGEYTIEAGALMLANNGICCIDEFDKMELRDQVAIHEAMEQQTISLSKAGIKTSLSAKCSVLAAANPIFGRYDRSKSLRQNLSLTSPLISRFDLFFVLLDDCNADVDREIAKRIMQSGDYSNSETPNKVYSDRELHRYISFAKCFEPKMAAEILDKLEHEFELMCEREESSGTAWRMTIRQLESVIRLSEALARLRFSDCVTSEHVSEAIQLISQSYVRVTRPEVELNSTDVNNPEAPQEDSSTLKISFNEYQTICNKLLVKVRENELMADGENNMLKASQLIEWYLNNEIDLISDEVDYFRRKKQLELIIDRMAGPDKMLMKITRMELDGEEIDDAILSLHPNMPLNDYE